jgi:hypothetical protein
MTESIISFITFEQLLNEILILYDTFVVIFKHRFVMHAAIEKFTGM